MGDGHCCGQRRKGTARALPRTGIRCRRFGSIATERVPLTTSSVIHPLTVHRAPSPSLSPSLSGPLSQPQLRMSPRALDDTAKHACMHEPQCHLPQPQPSTTLASQIHAAIDRLPYLWHISTQSSQNFSTQSHGEQPKTRRRHVRIICSQFNPGGTKV